MRDINKPITIEQKLVKKLKPHSKSKDISSVSKDLGQFLVTTITVITWETELGDCHKFRVSLDFRIRFCLQKNSNKN